MRLSGWIVTLLVLAIGAAVALGWLAVGLGFVPPPWAATVVRIGNGRVSMARGQLRAQVREDLAEVLSGGGVTSGFIAITAEMRVCFSRNIPAALHQRLRNVLLN